MVKESRFQMRISDEKLEKLNIYAKSTGLSASKVMESFIDSLPEPTTVQILREVVKEEPLTGQQEEDALQAYRRSQVELKEIDSIARKLGINRIELIKRVLPLVRKVG